MVETQFITFFIILLVAVIFTSFFSRLNIPWAVALIVGGIVAGPGMFGWITPNDTMIFLGEVGAVFLMFMAGLETPIKSLKKNASMISGMAFFNGIIPMIVGILIAYYLGYTVQTALLVGIVFISSSVAVVIPTLDKYKLFGTSLGNVIIGSTIIQDIGSLILISIFLQVTNPVTWLPLPLFYILVFAFVFILYRVIKWLRKWVVAEGTFHQELQFLLFILTGVVVLFSILGIHHIIAGFFTGFVLAEPLKNRKIKHTLHTVGYGIFIPIFFVLVGTNTDFSLFKDSSNWLLILIFIIGLIVSKFASGYFVARIQDFNKYDSLLSGVTSIPQLATTLAVSYTAYSLGLIGSELVTAFVALSIVTTIITPIWSKYILDKRVKIS